MPEVEETRASVQQSLSQVIDLLQKGRVVEELVRRQDMPRKDLIENLTHRQTLAGLQQKLDDLHPADVACILDALARDQRLILGSKSPTWCANRSSRRQIGGFATVLV